MSVLPGEGDTVILYGSTDIPIGARVLGGYLARPDLEGEWPTVVVLPSAWGITSSVKDWCRRLARHGIAAIVPDLYRGEAPDRTVEPDVASKAFDEIPLERRRADLEGTVEFLANPAGFWSNAEWGFGLLGFGDGGSVAAWAAGFLGAAALGLVGAPLVADDGRPGTPVPEVAEGLTLPVLGLFGGDDPRSPDEGIAALRDRLPQAEVVRYPNVGEDYWDDYLDGYVDAAARDTLERLVRFFGATLPPRR